jgi:hypothetical protein
MKYRPEKKLERAAQQPDRRRTGAAFAVLGSLTASLPAPVFAAEWSVRPSIGVAVGSNNNPTLTAGVDQDSTSTSYGVLLLIEGGTELSRLKLDAGSYWTKYAEDEFEDTDGRHATLNASHQATERSSLDLNVDVRREILYESAQREGTGDLRNVDVGLVQAKVRRDGAVASPSWSYATSERGSVGLSMRTDNVEYTNAAGTDLVDYRQMDGGLAYSYRIGVQDQLSLSVGASGYRPDTGGNESDTMRVLGGWSREFSETLDGRISFGRSWTTEQTAAGDAESSGAVVEIGANQRSELSTLEAIISRDVQPSGGGRSVESTQLRLHYARKLSTTTEFVIGASTFRNKVLEGSDPEVDRRYSEIVPEFRWQLTPAWSLGASYSFRKQKFDVDSDSAESTAVFVGMTYAPQRFRGPERQ